MKTNVKVHVDKLTTLFCRKRRKLPDNGHNASAKALDANPASNETARYETVDFTGKSSSESEDANIYLSIPDSLLSSQHGRTTATADSAIARDEFAEKLAKMTDADFAQQFQVIHLLSSTAT